MGEIIFKKKHEDARGKVYELEFNNNKFLLTTYTKGAPRGAHFHNFDIPHVIVSGKFLCKEMNPDTKKEKEFEVNPGDIINVKAKTIHMFTALEEGVILELRPDESATNYPPWRKIVEDFLENNKV